MNELTTHARRYAAWGWHVFALRPQSKKPAVPSHTANECDRTDPHCGDGHLGWEERATINRDEIDVIWSTGRYGIGIATGPSGLLVLDIDHKTSGDSPNGFDSLARLETATGRVVPTDTLTVATPSGGQHRYYIVPAGYIAPSTAGRLGPGLDTRGRGGYVAAAPTQLDNGPYRITRDRPPVPLPRWLADQLTNPTTSTTTVAAAAVSVGGRRPAGEGHARGFGVTVRRLDRYIAAAINGEVGRIVGAPIGERNHTLFLGAIALGQLVAGEHLEESEAVAVLHQAARDQETRPGDGYDERQATATIQSGLDRGLREPRILNQTPSRQ